MARELPPELKNDALMVMFGTSDITKLPPAWYPQKFEFHDQRADATFFGIKQEKGGPCGCYAAIQVGV